jgi:hypothetical protein
MVDFECVSTRMLSQRELEFDGLISMGEIWRRLYTNFSSKIDNYRLALYVYMRCVDDNVIFTSELEHIEAKSDDRNDEDYSEWREILKGRDVDVSVSVLRKEYWRVTGCEPKKRGLMDIKREEFSLSRLRLYIELIPLIGLRISDWYHFGVVPMEIGLNIQYDLTRFPIEMLKHLSVIDFIETSSSLHVLVATLFRIRMMSSCVTSNDESASFTGALPTDLVVMGNPEPNVRIGRRCISNVLLWNLGQSESDLESVLSDLLKKMELKYEDNVFEESIYRLKSYMLIAESFKLIWCEELGIDVWGTGRLILDNLGPSVAGHAELVEMKSASTGVKVSELEHPLSESMIESGTEERYMGGFASLLNSSCTIHETVKLISDGDALLYLELNQSNLMGDIKEDVWFPLVYFYPSQKRNLQCPVCAVTIDFWSRKKIETDVDWNMALAFEFLANLGSRPFITYAKAILHTCGTSLPSLPTFDMVVQNEDRERLHALTDVDDIIGLYKFLLHYPRRWRLNGQEFVELIRQWVTCVLTFETVYKILL